MRDDDVSLQKADNIFQLELKLKVGGSRNSSCGLLLWETALHRLRNFTSSTFESIPGQSTTLGSSSTKGSNRWASCSKDLSTQHVHPLLPTSFEIQIERRRLLGLQL